MLSIIMYHYVRDLRNSRYPQIRGLDIELFREQIEFLRRHFSFVTIDEILAAGTDFRGNALPKNAAFLTFDDGYADHFNFVFPILKNLGIQGAFFVPAKAVREHSVLDVNKIHFILAGTPSEKMPALAQEIRRRVERDFAGTPGLLAFDEYCEKYKKPNRFDDAETAFVKRLLQFALPAQIRSQIAKELFEEIVEIGEAIFSRELYLSADQMRCMAGAGMHFGCHTANHRWLGTISRDEQRRELQAGFEFVEEIIGGNALRSVAYPFGDFNAETLEIMRELNAKIGFTTVPAAADFSAGTQLLTLPRFDTNDFPKNRDAAFPQNLKTL